MIRDIRDSSKINYNPKEIKQDIKLNEPEDRFIPSAGTSDLKIGIPEKFQISEKVERCIHKDNDACQIDDKTIEKLKGKIPSVRLETLNKYKGVYHSKKAIDDAFKPLYSYYDKVDTFNDEELELIKNNVTGLVVEEAEATEPVKSEQETMRKTEEPDKPVKETKEITAINSKNDSICKNIIAEVNRILEDVKSLGHNNTKEGKIKLDTIKIPIGKNSKGLNVYREIEGTIEYDKETKKVKFFSGVEKQYGDGDYKWNHLLFREEQVVKITDDIIKNLEGKINVKELESLLNIEFSPCEFPYALDRTRLWDIEKKEVEEEIKQNPTFMGGVRGTYKLSVYEERKDYTVYVKDGNMSLTYVEEPGSILPL